MTWTDVTREPKPNVVRQLGVVCWIVFAGLGLSRRWTAAEGGRRSAGFLAETWGLLQKNKKWWLPPIAFVLVRDAEVPL